MMRDRLTTDKRKIFARECPTLMSMTKDELRRLYNEIFDRLQEYEVAEETGQIIVPPCKKGDTIYVILHAPISKRYYIKETDAGNIHSINGYWYVEIFSGQELEFGVKAFTSKEEAEQALSKLQASYEQVKGGAD